MYHKNDNIQGDQLAKFVKDNAYLGACFVRQLKELPSAGEYTIAASKARADIFANEIWGDPTWGWILCVYNGITVYEMTFGKTIKYPSKEDVNNLIASL